MNYLAYGKLFWLFPILVWGCLAALSAQWGLIGLSGMAENLAYERAQSMFQLVQMTRLWNARHGGVYVMTSETTPSNPYLEDPFKDVVTTQGMELTKLNPAYMTRQIAEVAKESSGILFHITSLKPINPGNEADPWETNALASFEKDTPEVLEYMDRDDVPIYRYMGPLVTKPACMKCHAKQGYSVGDVRGGISVTLPAAPILDAQSSARDQVIYVNLSAFVLLTVTTLILVIALRRQWRLVNETKEKLAGSERFLRSITDAAGEGVVTMDGDGEITFSNPEADRLLGWRDSTAAQDNESDGKRDKGILRSKESVAKPAIAPGSDPGSVIRENDGHFVHRDGHRIPVSFVVSPILDGSKVSGTVILFQDITMRKEMEKTLVRSETMSALGGMVAGVAHEVNTPIGVAVTSASHLTTKSDELFVAMNNNALTRSGLRSYLETAKESTNIVLSNLRRASEMIKSFKQVAADRASEARSRFNLQQYLNNVLLTLGPELKGTNLEVTLNCPEGIELDSYPGALSQVISNLLMNSKIHAFSKDNSGTLTFDILESGEDVRIVYRDNGKGISEKHLDEIFAPFFTTRRGQGSSGLGLHISQNLVHTVLNGTITVTSQLGEGTEFTLTIPKSPNYYSAEHMN